MFRSTVLVMAGMANLQVCAQEPLLQASEVASGLDPVLSLGHPPGDRTRLFIVEGYGSTGYIRVLDLAAGHLLQEPFLAVPVMTGGERGLLGLAFDPQYATNGRFYIHMSRPFPQGSYVVRYNVSANPNVADPASAVGVLFEPQSAYGHVGGWIGFGPEGMLYVSLGDITEPFHSLSLAVVFGKMLRLDVSELPYSIPGDNPFVGVPGARAEIWALGLRNPWRASFDRLTGDLYIADVGSSFYEEINFQPAASAGGQNYGWPCYEGTHVLSTIPICPSNPVFPIHTIPYQPGCWVTGGYVYRGEAMPWLRGRYFFKSCLQQLRSFRIENGQAVDLRDHTAELTPPTGLVGIYTFGEDAAGELYFVSGNIPGQARVFRIEPRCWANCDGSTQAPALHVDDFACFLQRFVGGDPYANCDGSTVAPVLNIADFACFIRTFAAGCP